MMKTDVTPMDDQRSEATPGLMRAAVQHGYGTALAVEERPLPEPGPGQVLVRVEAAGVSRGAWHLAVGKPYAVRLALGLRRPRNPVPGLEVTGRVAAVGAEVTQWSVGDAVMGMGRATFAEHALADAKALVARPDDLDVAEAAGMTDPGSTAHQALHRHARIGAGERVLVIGASGAVGSFAVLFAVAAGAEVVGVASEGKADFVRGLGAKDVIDYRREAIDARGGGYDVVLDIAGNRSVRELRRVLALKGRLVIVGGEDGGPLLGGLGRQVRARLLGLFTGQRMTGMLARPTAAAIEELLAVHRAGGLAPVVTRRYSLDEAGQALHDLEAGRVTGKTVVVL
ncbi:NAD(P)-dependent alcohol dehydrogenase [Nocardioides iriomotensis]|nr:NAD(P)-dependent alcohol dehydrogenase [Nocardioides iriomotensis]